MPRRLTTHEAAAYKLARDLASTLLNEREPLKESSKGVIYKIIADLRKRSVDDEVTDRIVWALAQTQAAAEYVGRDKDATKTRVQNARRHLQILSRIAVLPDAPRAAAKKAAQSKPKERRTNPKVLAQYRENFKKAQESLETPRVVNDQGWTRTAKPHGAAGILRRGDDEAYGIRWDPEEVERIERRDRQAIRDWAEGYRPPCPIAEYKVQDRSSDEFVIQPLVQDAQGNMNPVGSLYANRSPGERTRWISGSADVPIETLAACPGLGNGMYLAAANEACKRRGRLTGSSMRSVFSEHFWKKQIEKGRAECDDSRRADYYRTPLKKAITALEDGKITVPQFNELRKRMPEGGPDFGRWDCEYVPLKREWCKTPKPKRTLRGVQRYRIESKGR